MESVASVVDGSSNNNQSHWHVTTSACRRSEQTSFVKLNAFAKRSFPESGYILSAQIRVLRYISDSEYMGWESVGYHSSYSMEQWGSSTSGSLCTPRLPFGLLSLPSRVAGKHTKSYASPTHVCILFSNVYMYSSNSGLSSRWSGRLNFHIGWRWFCFPGHNALKPMQSIL